MVQEDSAAVDWVDMEDKALDQVVLTTDTVAADMAAATVEVDTQAEVTEVVMDCDHKRDIQPMEFS